MWRGVVGHDRQVESFRAAVSCGRLASSYLFVGPEGIGKRMFALRLAEVLLCLDRDEAGFAPCGVCESCRLIAAGAHPDLDRIAKPEGKSSLPVELFIGDWEHRMQEGLCYRLGLKPYVSGRKVAIVDDADLLRAESANCLLKTLEEPPPGSLLILIGTSAARQLPTIRSRCQIVRFERLEPCAVEQVLTSRAEPMDAVEAREVGLAGEGSVALALVLADGEIWSFRSQFLTYLAESVGPEGTAGQQAVEFVEAAGRELSLRRVRLRLLVDWAIGFYGDLVKEILGVARPESDSVLSAAISRAVAKGEADLDGTLDRLDRCLVARQHIDRNAHPTTLIEAWLDGLRHLTSQTMLT